MLWKEAIIRGTVDWSINDAQYDPFSTRGNFLPIAASRTEASNQCYSLGSEVPSGKGKFFEEKFCIARQVAQLREVEHSRGI